MSANDNLVKQYLLYYNLQQRGGNVAGAVVYKGLRRWDQRGGGDQIGDSNRGVKRIVAPFLAHGISKFLTEAANSYSKGSDIKSAALGAIAPALVSSFSNSQSGQGGVRRRKRNANKKKRSVRRVRNQSGTGKKRNTQYKKRLEDHSVAPFLLKKTTRKRKSRKIKQAKHTNF
jgi:hypothetical protein